MTAPGAESVPSPGYRLLFVCTGNICRSAAAERLARRQLEALLGAAAASVLVHSAGTRAAVGSAIHPDSASVLRRLGGDDEQFTARRLRRQMVTEADLVLTMTREHRQAVLGLEPRALSRTFTLREAADLVRLLDAPPGTTRTAGDGGPRGLALRMAAARRLRTSSAEDDIVDPMGGPPEAHRRAGESIAECLGPVLDHVVRHLGS
ncbi:low molecular weight phosphatase family protein [Geodermatophilus sabuli]|uniref:Protein-tyrosine phosphatase n=1 Tax=Geodermatophilus sabuli TaxID=1564158 RepID=A0A285EGV6_9ACTN|nr:low molecular weight phosphatase family protein [Geodermatophilus sabuli]MBB3083222.1 protein-tyrosine phosphatase [Geodermatophilus sabuli]SNX98217.1 protein-tyrosine phosphatase [Geodermatophilus sabuli]